MELREGRGGKSKFWRTRNYMAMKGKDLAEPKIDMENWTVAWL